MLKDVIRFRNGRKRPAQSGTVPVYGGNGILGYADAANYANCVVIGRVGAYCGSVYYEEGDCWVSDNAIAACAYDIDTVFSYYLLKSLKLNERRIGTGQPLLTQEILNRIACGIPAERAEQEKISGILQSLDRKIALNAQINDNLQQIAHSIFSHEFISESEDCTGWNKGSLLDIADYINGLAMQKYRPEDGEAGIPVLKIKELRQGFCGPDSELCSPGIKKQYLVHDGDVIFSWSGSLLVDFWCGGLCGLNQHLFKVTSRQYDKWFYYSWTNHYLEKFTARAADMATTMGHIKREELKKAEVLIPSRGDYLRIGSLLGPIYDRIIEKRIENRKLSALRDALLPRLMSGELDVSGLDI